MVGGKGFSAKERFGGHFDRYRSSGPDGRNVGGEIRKKNHRMGHRARPRIF